VVPLSCSLVGTGSLSSAVQLAANSQNAHLPAGLWDTATGGRSGVVKSLAPREGKTGSALTAVSSQLSVAVMFLWPLLVVTSDLMWLKDPTWSLWPRARAGDSPLRVGGGVR
jgi:hypothetical protein